MRLPTYSVQTVPQGEIIRMPGMDLPEPKVLC